MTTSNNLATSINRFWLTREWSHGSKTHRQFYDAHTGFKNVDQSYVEYWATEHGILINDITNKGKLQETHRPLWIPNEPQVTKVDMYYVENQWKPSAIKPSDLDLESALDAASPFVDFMKLGFGGANWQWVINWLAYRYQVPKPDKKPGVAPLARTDYCSVKGVKDESKTRGVPARISPTNGRVGSHWA